VVCDASTLIALARIGQLEILERTGAQVVIPRAVYEEVVVQGEGKPGATEVSEAAWIETREVTDHSIVARFRRCWTLVKVRRLRWRKRSMQTYLFLMTQRPETPHC
jgi:predicted nucleic acid-binding protein